jgi:hypothetical protein
MFDGRHAGQPMRPDQILAHTRHEAQSSQPRTRSRTLPDRKPILDHPAARIDPKSTRTYGSKTGKLASAQDPATHPGEHRRGSCRTRRHSRGTRPRGEHRGRTRLTRTPTRSNHRARQHHDSHPLSPHRTPSGPRSQPHRSLTTLPSLRPQNHRHLASPATTTRPASRRAVRLQTGAHVNPARRTLPPLP